MGKLQRDVKHTKDIKSKVVRRPHDSIQLFTFGQLRPYSVDPVHHLLGASP